MHAMLMDTSHNSTTTVMSNLYTCFLETAKKLFYYAKSLPVKRRPNTNLMLSTAILSLNARIDIASLLIMCAETIRDVASLAWALMRRKGRCHGKWNSYECDISYAKTKMQVQLHFSNIHFTSCCKDSSVYDILRALLRKVEYLYEL